MAVPVMLADIDRKLTRVMQASTAWRLARPSVIQWSELEDLAGAAGLTCQLRDFAAAAEALGAIATELDRAKARSPRKDSLSAIFMLFEREVASGIELIETYRSQQAAAKEQLGIDDLEDDLL